jgi:hypothetical protein
LVLYGKINPELEKKFRIKAVEKYSGKKRALNMALEDAIRLWLKS